MLATVSDKRTAVSVNGSTIDHYEADIVSAQEYYPFGMLMPGRSFNSSKYRYGFNGQEKSDEIDPNGNHNTVLFWEYDSRLGRSWNLDPKPNLAISLYATFYDNPIAYKDPLGDTSFQFKPDGSLFRIVSDGKTENTGLIYLKEFRKKGMTYYSNPLKFKFADPINDPISIESLRIEI